MQLSDKQWKEISALVSHRSLSKSNRGRPPLDKREVMNAILWVLGKGARWKEMPTCYPQYQTCRNYFYEWSKKGAMGRVVKVLENTSSLPKDKILDCSNIQAVGVSKKKLSVVIKKIAKDSVT